MVVEIFEGICRQDPKRRFLFLQAQRKKGERASRLENENSSLKEMRERISMLEHENSSLRKLKTNWQQRCIILMASMLALATEADMKTWKTRALLLTISDRLLPSDHCISDDVLTRVEEKPEDCIQPWHVLKKKPKD